MKGVSTLLTVPSIVVYSAFNNEERWRERRSSRGHRGETWHERVEIDRRGRGRVERCRSDGESPRAQQGSAAQGSRRGRRPLPGERAGRPEFAHVLLGRRLLGSDPEHHLAGFAHRLSGVHGHDSGRREGRAPRRVPARPVLLADGIVATRRASRASLRRRYQARSGIDQPVRAGGQPDRQAPLLHGHGRRPARSGRGSRTKRTRCTPASPASPASPARRRAPGRSCSPSASISPTKVVTSPVVSVSRTSATWTRAERHRRVSPRARRLAPSPARPT